MNALIVLGGLLGVVTPTEGPPPAAVALVSALESGDLAAARATLAEEITIADSSSGTGQESSFEALSTYARGCARSNLSWDHDSAEPANATISFTWTCPSRAPTQTLIWTAGERVVWVQFGLRDPETWMSLPNQERPR